MNVSGNESFLVLKCARVPPASVLVLTGPMSLLCALLGCVGNAVGVWRGVGGGVEFRRSLRFLLLWDSLLLFSSVLYYAARNTVLLLFGQPSGLANSVMAYSTLIAHMWTGVSYTASAWFVLGLTAQRYLAVSRPFRHLVTNNPLTLGSILSVLAILVSLPTLTEIQIGTCYLNATGEVVDRAVPSPIRMNHLYFRVYNLFTQRLILTNLGPSLLLAILTVLLILHLRSASLQQVTLAPGSGTRHNKEEFYRSFILVLLALKFLLSHTLPTILDVWEAWFLSWTHIQRFLFFTRLSNFLAILNSATNSLLFIRTKRSRTESVKTRSTQPLSERSLPRNSRKGVSSPTPV